ncbi:unnamed protein product [Linum tenue]|uniref:Uncharacterized protein n=1 Tax=Linum tenue TaxID=586396 RepID=A0AAV0QUF8_9ROSI|nr:unnamed protein product [Linum tenue]
MAMEAAMVAVLDRHANVSAGGKPVNNWYEKKGKTNKKLYKEMWAPKDHHSDRRNRNGRHFTANRPPPPRVGYRPVEEKLRMAEAEIRVLNAKIQVQHQESMEAMDFQEQFFKDQIKTILEGRIGDDDGGGKEEKEEEDAADCHLGTISVLEPEPESRPTSHMNKEMQRIVGVIEKMRKNKWEPADN